MECTEHIPIWLGQLLDEVEEKARRQLLAKCKLFREAVEKESELLDEHRFLSILVDQDKITEGCTFSKEEMEALSAFMKAEDDIRYYMWIELYGNGYRDCLKMLGEIGCL